MTLLEVRDLTVTYRVRGRAVLAVDGVSLDVAPGESVGVVGESGSGKSTLGKAILGLVQVTSGSIRFAGEDITRAPSRVRRRLASDLQVVFQDPYSSLNPTRTVGQSLAEPLVASGEHNRETVHRKVTEALAQIHLPADVARRYPGQFSGGQRQRIAIARAVINDPKLIVCDEPVSALDLSIQAQVLNLLQEMQRLNHLALLFIGHDLAVVRHISDRIAVFNQGRIVEEGPAGQICEHPREAYTRALLDASPVPIPSVQRKRRAERRRTALSA